MAPRSCRIESPALRDIENLGAYLGAMELRDQEERMAVLIAQTREKGLDRLKARLTKKKKCS